MSGIRIAMAQVNTTVGDFRGNIEKIGKFINQARDLGVDLVTFPELCLCGYPPEDLLLNKSFLKDNREALNRIVSFSTDIAVIIGFAHQEDGRVFNAAALLYEEQIKGIYYKTELPNYGVFDEKRYFTPGKECFLFEIENTRFSLTICEDIWIKNSLPYECAEKNQADVTLNISASPYYSGKTEVRLKILNDFATVTNCLVFWNNLVGGQDELVFDGRSMVVDHGGHIRAAAKQFQEDLLIYDLPESTQTRSRTWNVSPESPVKLTIKRISATPVVPRIEAPYDRTEEIYRALVLGTADYVKKNGFTKVVIGLSGGIDSALTAAIAVDALGSDKVIGVTMPSQYTSDETFDDARGFAANLNLQLYTIPVKPVYDSYIEMLKDPFGPGPLGIEAENLQARIRGNYLMALSNRFGWLVLTTGNKSETAVGYCTLYGDMAGGFAVLKDVPKTLVYELSFFVNKKAEKEVIPISVLERPPSAELRPDQKDEDSLPPYSILDPILKAYIEEDMAPEDITGFDPAVVREVVRMVERNEYKRRQAPPGVKITPKAFGKDRRLPITNHYWSNHLRGFK